MFSVLSQIRKRFEYMTPVEQRIANFMLDNPTKVINMPVKDIARNSDTSDAAIVRFSKRIGLAGIKELKVELAKELHTLEKENISRVIDLEQDTHKDIFDKEIKSIKCLSSMRIDSTYLAWVDFSKTGEPENTNYKKLINHAKIISKRGSTFGLGGYNHFRFNLATSIHSDLSNK